MPKDSFKHDIQGNLSHMLPTPFPARLPPKTPPHPHTHTLPFLPFLTSDWPSEVLAAASESSVLWANTTHAPQEPSAVLLSKKCVCVSMCGWMGAQVRGVPWCEGLRSVVLIYIVLRVGLHLDIHHRAGYCECLFSLRMCLGTSMCGCVGLWHWLQQPSYHSPTS